MPKPTEAQRAHARTLLESHQLVLLELFGEHYYVDSRFAQMVFDVARGVDPKTAIAQAQQRMNAS